MNKQKNYQHIVVIGAGPAGCMTAYLLEKKGFEVTIIDKQEKVKRKVCGEYLCPSGVKIIEDLGLSNELMLDFKKLNGMRIFSPKGREIVSFFPNQRYGISVNRQRLDERLRILLGTDTDVSTYFGEVFLEIKKIDNSWIVKTNKRGIKADLVVGADGIHSNLAKQLGHTVKTDDKKIALHVFLKLKNQSDYKRMGEMHIFNDGAYCGLDPIDSDEINFSIVCDKAKLSTLKPYQIINHYIKKSKVLSGMFSLVSPVEKVSSLFPIHNENHFVAGNDVAYVGDAAGFVDPLTGEGMYGAIFSAQLLATCMDEKPTEEGIANYKKLKEKTGAEKIKLNNVFQIIIKYSFICEVIAWFLMGNQHRSDIFVSIIGNIYTPIEGFKKMWRKV